MWLSYISCDEMIKNSPTKIGLKVQFSCLGSAMTKCLFSATHKIILNSCRVTLLQWIDNFCDFEIRMLQILVCWTYFLLFQNFTEEQFKTYKVSCYVKTLNQSMQCLNFKIFNCHPVPWDPEDESFNPFYNNFCDMSNV